MSLLDKLKAVAKKKVFGVPLAIPAAPVIAAAAPALGLAATAAGVVAAAGLRPPGLGTELTGEDRSPYTTETIKKPGPDASADEVRRFIDASIGKKDRDEEIVKFLTDTYPRFSRSIETTLTELTGATFRPYTTDTMARIGTGNVPGALSLDPYMPLDRKILAMLQADDRMGALYLRETDPQSLLPYLPSVINPRRQKSLWGAARDIFSDTLGRPIGWGLEAFAWSSTQVEMFVGQKLVWNDVPDAYLRSQLARQTWELNTGRHLGWDFRNPDTREIKDRAREILDEGLRGEDAWKKLEPLVKSHISTRDFIVGAAAQGVFDPLNLVGIGLLKPISAGIRVGVGAEKLGILAKLPRVLGPGRALLGEHTLKEITLASERSYQAWRVASPARGPALRLFEQTPGGFSSEMVRQFNQVFRNNESVTLENLQLFDRALHLPPDAPLTAEMEALFGRQWLKKPQLSRFGAMMRKNNDSLINDIFGKETRKQMEATERLAKLSDDLNPNEAGRLLRELATSHMISWAAKEQATYLPKLVTQRIMPLVAAEKIAMGIFTLSRPSFIALNVANNVFTFLWHATNPLDLPAYLKTWGQAMWIEGTGGRAALPKAWEAALGAADMSPSNFYNIVRSGGSAGDLLALKTKRVIAGELDETGDWSQVLNVVRGLEKNPARLNETFTWKSLLAWPVSVASRTDNATRASLYMMSLKEQMHWALRPKILFPKLQEFVTSKGVFDPQQADTISHALTGRVRDAAALGRPVTRPSEVEAIYRETIAHLADQIIPENSILKYMMDWAAEGGFVGDAALGRIAPLQAIEPELNAVMDDVMDISARMRSARFDKAVDNLFDMDYLTARMTQTEPVMRRGFTYARHLRVSEEALRQATIDEVSHLNRLFDQVFGSRWNGRLRRSFIEPAGDLMAKQMDDLAEIRRIHLDALAVGKEPRELTAPLWDKYWESQKDRFTAVYQKTRDILGEVHEGPLERLDEWFAAHQLTTARHRELLTDALETGTEEAWAAAGESVKNLYLQQARRNAEIFGWEPTGNVVNYGHQRPSALTATLADDFVEWLKPKLTKDLLKVSTESTPEASAIRTRMREIRKAMKAPAAPPVDLKVQARIRLEGLKVKVEEDIRSTQAKIDNFPQSQRQGYPEDTALWREQITEWNDHLRDIESQIKGLPAPTPAAPTVNVEELNAFKAAEVGKLIKPNAATGQRSVDRLRSRGFDTSEADDALENYRGIDRHDYDDAEEYLEARGEAWDEFKTAIDDLDATDLVEEAAAVAPPIDLKPEFKELQTKLRELEKTGPLAAQTTQRRNLLGALDEMAPELAGEMGNLGDMIRANASAKTDFGMLNYHQQFGMDSVLQMFFPYLFFPSRTVVNWGIRMARAPGMAALVAKALIKPEEYAELHGYPSRVKNMLPIPIPFLDDILQEMPGLNKMIQTNQFQNLYWINPMQIMFPLTSFTNDYDDEKKKGTPLGLIADWTEQNTPLGISPFIKILGSEAGLLDKSAWEQSLFSGGPFGLPVTVVGRTAANWLQVGDPGDMPEEEMDNYMNKGLFGSEFLARIMGMSNERFDPYRAERAMWALVATGDLSPDDAWDAMLSHSGQAWKQAVKYAKSDQYLRELTGSLFARVTPMMEGELKLKMGIKQAYNAAQARGPDAVKLFYETFPEYEGYQAAIKGISDPAEREAAVEGEVYHRLTQKFVEEPFALQLDRMDEALEVLRHQTQTEATRDQKRILMSQRAQIKLNQSAVRSVLDGSFPNREKELSINRDPFERALTLARNGFYDLFDEDVPLSGDEIALVRRVYLNDRPSNKDVVAVQKLIQKQVALDEVTEKEIEAAAGQQDMTTTEWKRQHYLRQFPAEKTQPDPTLWHKFTVEAIQTKLRFGMEIDKALKAEDFDKFRRLETERQAALESLHDKANGSLTRYDVERYLQNFDRPKTPEEESFEDANGLFDLWMALVGDHSPLRSRDKAAISAYFESRPEIIQHYHTSAIDIRKLTAQQLYALMRRREIWRTYRDIETDQGQMDYITSHKQELSAVNALLGLPPLHILDPEGIPPWVSAGRGSTDFKRDIYSDQQIKALTEKSLLTPEEKEQLERLIQQRDPSKLTEAEIDKYIRLSFQRGY